MKKENSPGPWQRIRWILSKHPDFLSLKVQHPKHGEAFVTFMSEFIWEHDDCWRESGQQDRVQERPLADGCLVFPPGDLAGTLQDKRHLLSSTANGLQVLHHIWQLEPGSTQLLMLPRTINSGLCSLLWEGLSGEIFYFSLSLLCLETAAYMVFLI